MAMGAVRKPRCHGMIPGRADHRQTLPGLCQILAVIILGRNFQDYKRMFNNFAFC
jgi:hypothetical protein